MNAIGIMDHDEIKQKNLINSLSLCHRSMFKEIKNTSNFNLLKVHNQLNQDNWAQIKCLGSQRALTPAQFPQFMVLSNFVVNPKALAPPD